MKKNIQISFMTILVSAVSVVVSCGSPQSQGTDKKEIGSSDSISVVETFEPPVSGINVGDKFVPAGYMGCDRDIVINPASTVNPHSGETCYEIKYTTSCNKNWAGVYWTNRADDSGANWGQYAGSDFSNAGYTKITFWARGAKGREAVEFGSGGIDKTNESGFRYKDSYDETYSTKGKRVILSDKWQQYTIDLTGKDLSSVIGGFFWSTSWNANPTGLVFYLDDIWLE